MKKVLAVAAEVYSDSLPSHSITGLSVMVRDIYNEVSADYDSYLLSSRCGLHKEEISPTLHILDSQIDTWKKQIQIIDVVKALRLILSGWKTVKRSIRNNAILRTQEKTFIKYLTEIQPDIVNFHEFDNLNTRLLNICMERNVKCVITNHLYIGNSAGCDDYGEVKRNESIILSKKNVYISAICTGMKNRILSDYPHIPASNVFLTINGTSFINKWEKKQSIVRTDKKKIILCIANVMARKNQVQLVRAVSKMPDVCRSRIQIYFLGSDNKKVLQNAIKEYRCEDVCVYKGKVRSEEMSNYYSNADAVITTTLCEGFGLTIIEGYSYGLPAIIPNDIDSFSDLYEPECAVEINGRKDEDIKDAIQKWISKDWNRDCIIKKSTLFSMTQCGNSYKEMYKQILNYN